MSSVDVQTAAPRLLFVVSVDWYFCSHRLALAVAALEQGFDVAVATNVGKCADRIRAAGIRTIPVDLSRRGMNPFGDLPYIRRLVGIYRRERPHIVHHVALKPVLYGSLAARLAGVRGVVNAVAGLGFIFNSSSAHARVVRPIVRQAFRALLAGPRSWTIVQNADDAAMLARVARLRPERIRVIRGAGVDLGEFKQLPEPCGVPTVVLLSRMLWDKGIREYVEAARKIRDHGVESRFLLVGGPDPENPASVAETQLRAWHDEGVVEWLGHRHDVAGILADAHIACLPSYREGLPKALLEALAAGRPIVTTDVPGCREVVIDGENGFLVPSRDPAALADALETLIRDKALRERFGRRGREIAEAEFGMEQVNETTLALYREIVAA